MLNLSTDQILNFNTLPTKCTEMNGDMPDPAEYTLCIVPIVDSSAGGFTQCHATSLTEQTSRYLAANWNTAVRSQTPARMSPDQMLRGSPQSCPDAPSHDSPEQSPEPEPESLGSPAFSDVSADSPQTGPVCGSADTVPTLDSVHSVVAHTPPSSSEEWDDPESDLFSGHLDLGSLDTYGAIPSHVPHSSSSPTTPTPSEGYDDEEEAENELLFYRNLELGTEEGVLKHVTMILSQFQRGILPDIAPKGADSTQSATPYTDVVENKKKTKDGKVKRPMNSFFTFSRVYRRKIIESRPNGVHNNIISSHLGRVWKSPLFEQHFKDFFKDGAQHMKLLHSKEFPEYRYRPRKKEKKAEEKVVGTRTSSGRVSKPRSRGARKGGKGIDKDVVASLLVSDPATDATDRVGQVKTEPGLAGIAHSPASPLPYPSAHSPVTPTPTRPSTPGDEVVGQHSPNSMTTPLTPASLTPGSPSSSCSTASNPTSLLTTTYMPGYSSSRALACDTSSTTSLALSLSGGVLASQVSSFFADTMNVICSDIASSSSNNNNNTTAIITTTINSTSNKEAMDFMELEEGGVDVDLCDLPDDFKFSKEDVFQFNEYCERIKLCMDTQ